MKSYGSGRNYSHDRIGMRIYECYRRGVALRQSVLENPSSPDVIRRINESRKLLAETVNMARKSQHPDLFGFMVSLGNAWKTPPGANLKKAIQLYDSADKIGGAPENRATLCKVYADALLEQGNPEDIRRAEKYLYFAIKYRRGRDLVETLNSAANVALHHPDYDDIERTSKAVDFLMDAVRADPEISTDILKPLVMHIRILILSKPESLKPKQLCEELMLLFPNQSREIKSHLDYINIHTSNTLKRVFYHPAGKIYNSIRIRLLSRSELNIEFTRIQENIGFSAINSAINYFNDISLIGNPDRIEKLIQELQIMPKDEAYPGRLAARVILLAYLARISRHKIEAVKTASVEAVQAIAHINENIVRSFLIREVAVVWAPQDFVADPVQDYSYAVGLLQQCIELEGGEDKALDDTIGYLAHALRFAQSGNIGNNIREARRLYRLRLERAYIRDTPQLIASIINNLSEVEAQMGVGSRSARLDSSIQNLREAVDKSNSSKWKNLFLSNLAWVITQKGQLNNSCKSIEYLEEALGIFNSIDLSEFDDHEVLSHYSNRTTCYATIVRRTEGRKAEVAVWNNYINSSDLLETYALATAKHNLAFALLNGKDFTFDELSLGLSIYREAIYVRTIEKNPRHNWETSFNAGRAIINALKIGIIGSQCLQSNNLYKEASTWLKQSVIAAQILGPGEEMVASAFALCELGLFAQSPEEMIRQTDDAWKVVREGAPYLLIHTESREQEARHAIQIAVNLAVKLSVHTLAIEIPGIMFVLHDEKADIVAEWMFRGQEPTRRPLRARISRPEKVESDLWSHWIDALNSRNERHISDVLDQIHELAPVFPIYPVSNDKTWEWLKNNRNSIAVSYIYFNEIVLALVMTINSNGKRMKWVFGLSASNAPDSLSRISEILYGDVPGNDFGAIHDECARWVRINAIKPIKRYLNFEPEVVLWSPGPGFRLIAPSAIWQDVPVAMTTALALPDLSEIPERPKSSLVVLADPGYNSKSRLGELGIKAIEQLSQDATKYGIVRLLGSVGKKYGIAVFGDRENVINAPASSDTILSNSYDYSVIVLIAHGQVNEIENAAIHCIDAEGNDDLLDVEKLSRNPNIFIGSTVILLSCESGRIGNSLSEPGGIAGTLISAGARCVIAPLWPVKLDIAVYVGKMIIQGIAKGQHPWEVLNDLRVEGDYNSPSLGMPPPSMSERKIENILQGMAFVTWLG